MLKFGSSEIRFPAFGGSLTLFYYCFEHFYTFYQTFYSAKGRAAAPSTPLNPPLLYNWACKEHLRIWYKMKQKLFQISNQIFNQNVVMIIVIMLKLELAGKRWPEENSWKHTNGSQRISSRNVWRIGRNGCILSFRIWKCSPEKILRLEAL